MPAENTGANNVKIEYAPKTVELPNNEFLHFWYANNKNRGCDNVTIIRSTAPRASMSKNQDNKISFARTSAWRGIVNFSKSVQAKLGI